jgi:transcriptional regulator with XRE-family HTH domain
MVTAAQIRAARALLGWSGARLAETAGVSLQTIRRMESDLGPGRSSAANVEAVRCALEDAGAVFVRADDENGAGVRIKRDHQG